MGAPVDDQDAATTGASSSWPCHALLDEPTTKVGINKPARRAIDRFDQGRVRDRLFALETRKRLRQENAQINNSTSVHYST